VSTSWQRRRSELNHDWLKNRYLPALAKWINILDDYVEDYGFEKDFLELTLPQWEEHRLLVIALIESFEIEMSPGIQLSHPPLSHLPESTKMWLHSLILRVPRSEGMRIKRPIVFPRFWIGPALIE
jgi:hypothetical protein